MRDADDLKAELRRLDGRGYKAYKELTGTWNLHAFELRFDHVQGDPFATPSKVSVLLSPLVAGLPNGGFASPARAEGTSALLARSFAELAKVTGRNRGTGRSGEIRMEHPGQVVMAQTAVQVKSDGTVEARFTVGLPANGRRIAGHEAAALLLEDVPTVVRAILLAGAHDEARVEDHAAANEDAEALRQSLGRLGLIGFVADGARLPRRSGVDDRPLEGGNVVAFSSPSSMRLGVELPNAGTVEGLGISEGVTLIVGGGFHGKSTLLRALQNGVYNHPPGDGRELVVTRSDAVKVRAEDGRSVAGVDISPFIDGLPLGHDTHRFTTTNASGSTSQAAAIAESLEAGAGVLLVDEDTSATNFMIRDRRMQELVPKAFEPITPFVDRVREVYETQGVSTVLVLGGSGDYLDVADRVLRMSEYRPEDVSEEARRVAEHLPTGRRPESAEPIGTPPARRLERSSLDPSKGRRNQHVKTPDERTLVFGRDTVDLAAVEQLVGRAQMRAIGLAMAWIATEAVIEVSDFPSLLDHVDEALEGGLDAFDDRRSGDLMAFRRFELAAALNRLRSLRVE